VTMPWYMENAIMKAKDTANLWWQSCAPWFKTYCPQLLPHVRHKHRGHESCAVKPYPFTTNNTWRLNMFKNFDILPINAHNPAGMKALKNPFYRQFWAFRQSRCHRRNSDRRIEDTMKWVPSRQICLMR
jgi:hypothetical protein